MFLCEDCGNILYGRGTQLTETCVEMNTIYITRVLKSFHGIATWWQCKRLSHLFLFGTFDEQRSLWFSELSFSVSSPHEFLFSEIKTFSYGFLMNKIFTLTRLYNYQIKRFFNPHYSR